MTIKRATFSINHNGHMLTTKGYTSKSFGIYGHNSSGYKIAHLASYCKDIAIDLSLADAKRFIERLERTGIAWDTLDALNVCYHDKVIQLKDYFRKPEDDRYSLLTLDSRMF